MGMEWITKADLQEFRLQLVEDIRGLLGPREERSVKPWLKNADVRKLLGVSSNTIQRLRIAGKLRSSKVGGIHYYRFEDIQQLMEAG
jgi:hypothetical protein